MSTNRIRYKQRDFHLDEIEKFSNLDWSLERFGCGPTSIANILVNYGYDVTPVDMAKKILFNKQGKFDDTFLRKRGINDKGLIYCLDRLIQEDKMNIDYEIVKIDFANPNNQKNKIIDMVKKGNMAIIHVGPSEISPLTFSKNGHYLVISDIDKNDNFCVINSNKTGDDQIGISFDYDTIIKNMTGRKDSFNFLFIKKTKL